MQCAVAIDELAAAEGGADAMDVARLGRHQIGTLADGDLATIQEAGGTGRIAGRHGNGCRQAALHDISKLEDARREGGQMIIGGDDAEQSGSRSLECAQISGH